MAEEMKAFAVNVHISGHCLFIREPECFHVLLPSHTHGPHGAHSGVPPKHCAELHVPAAAGTSFDADCARGVRGYKCLDVTSQDFWLKADPPTGVQAVTGLRAPKAQWPNFVDQSDYRWVSTCPKTCDPEELFTRLRRDYGCGRIRIDSGVLRAEHARPDYKHLPWHTDSKRAIAVGVVCTMVVHAVRFPGVLQTDLTLTALPGRNLDVFIFNDVQNESSHNEDLDHINWLLKDCCPSTAVEEPIVVCERPNPQSQSVSGRADAQETGEETPAVRRFGSAYCPGLGIGT